MSRSNKYRLDSAIAACGAEGQVVGLSNAKGEQFAASLYYLTVTEQFDAMKYFVVAFQQSANIDKKDFDTFAVRCAEILAAAVKDMFPEDEPTE